MGDHAGHYTYYRRKVKSAAPYDLQNANQAFFNASQSPPPLQVAAENPSGPRFGQVPTMPVQHHPYTCSCCERITDEVPICTDCQRTFEMDVDPVAEYSPDYNIPPSGIQTPNAISVPEERRARGHHSGRRGKRMCPQCRKSNSLCVFNMHDLLEPCRRCRRLQKVCENKVFPGKKQAKPEEDSVHVWNRDSSLFEHTVRTSGLSPQQTFARFNEDARIYFQGSPGTFPPAADENQSLTRAAEDRDVSTFMDLGPNSFPALGTQEDSPSTLFQFETVSQEYVYRDSLAPQLLGPPIPSLGPTVTSKSPARNTPPAMYELPAKLGNTPHQMLPPSMGWASGADVVDQPFAPDRLA